MNTTLEEMMMTLTPAEREEVEARAAKLIAEEYARREAKHTRNKLYDESIYDTTSTESLEQPSIKVAVES